MGIIYEVSDILVDVWTVRLEVEDMENESLISELLEDPYDNDEINRITHNFFKHEFITEKDREKLIAYYVLMYCDSDIEI